MVSAVARAYNRGLGAVPPSSSPGPPEAGSILAAKGELEKALCLFFGEFRTLKITKLDGSYLHCDLITVGYIEIQTVGTILYTYTGVT